MQRMEEIYREYSQAVYRYLLSLTRDADTAQELTQETFYQAVKGISRYDGKCKITTWLFAIAKNCLAAYRRKNPELQELDTDTPGGMSPEGSAMASAGNVELLRMLHKLSGDVREVMYLRLLGNLSFREIGDVMSRSENWARVTYYRGRERLKKELNSDGE